MEITEEQRQAYFERVRTDPEFARRGWEKFANPADFPTTPVEQTPETRKAVEELKRLAEREFGKGAH